MHFRGYTWLHAAAVPLFSRARAAFLACESCFSRARERKAISYATQICWIELGINVKSCAYRYPQKADWFNYAAGFGRRVSVLGSLRCGQVYCIDCMALSSTQLPLSRGRRPDSMSLAPNADDPLTMDRAAPSPAPEETARVASQRAAQLQSLSAEGLVQQIFALFDADGDGVLNMAEYGAFLSSIEYSKEWTAAQWEKECALLGSSGPAGIEQRHLGTLYTNLYRGHKLKADFAKICKLHPTAAAAPPAARSRAAAPPAAKEAAAARQAVGTAVQVPRPPARRLDRAIEVQREGLPMAEHRCDANPALASGGRVSLSNHSRSLSCPLGTGLRCSSKDPKPSICQR